jgi:hypothetical protein
MAAFAILTLQGLTGCDKANNTIDNSQVVETPYTLYFSDSAGAIYNTNDGIYIKKLPFSSDGTPCNAICTDQNTLLFVKDYLYFSTDNGNTFNKSYGYTLHHRISAVNGLPIDLNQSQVANVPRWNKMYCVSSDPNPLNYLGLAYSYWQGIWHYWTLEQYYDSTISLTPYPTATSMTWLPKNYLYCYDGIHQRYFYRTDTFNWTKFEEVYCTTPLPTTGFFSIGHINNEIIAIDNTGQNGAWYSDDLGANWYQFSGLPANTPLLCVTSPFEETCLIGTDSAGLFSLNANTHTFQADNHGLPNNCVVFNIAQKENFYKNGTTQKLVYLASNKGLYVSHDLGFNWTLVVKGNYTCVY